METVKNLGRSQDLLQWGSGEHTALDAREEELLLQQLRLELLVGLRGASGVAFRQCGIVGEREEVAVDAQASPLELERVELVLQQRGLFTQVPELVLLLRQAKYGYRRHAFDIESANEAHRHIP